ncbi:hypothetical protein BD410DRAFT_794873 [Rickenella mellea]|uniref:Uncharacterized protein n=1 Tax=Rickenella mellea TaxID=50990 RepID=A0A4Y7PPT2_9AGAM|nr:hypothetical protein BD410DRAFT_794873 [Rickenella mellea]
MYIQFQETFQSANTRNIDELQALTRKYVRRLIGSSDEQVQRPTDSGHHLSVDEEVKRLRAEEDHFNIQANQADQCIAVLQSALKQEYENRGKRSLGHFEIKRKLEGVLSLREAKLPKLPRNILSKICEQYQLNEDEIRLKQQNRYEVNLNHLGWFPGRACDPGEICGIICGRHKSISVKLDDQSLGDKIAQDSVARLNVSTSMNFSPYPPQANSLSLKVLDTALEFADRWDRLTIDEDQMAVDFVLYRCESVLPVLRVLDIKEKNYRMSGVPGTWGWPQFTPDTSREPRLQDATTPLGYILHSKWLFKRVNCLSLCLPAKLDEPSHLVDCLEGLTELRRLTLRAFTEFDVRSYATAKVAHMSKLMELEIMFDNLDINVLKSMLQRLSCPNLKKYVAHFVPVLEEHDRFGGPKSREFAIDVWALLDDKFPSLRDLEIGNHSAWGEGTSEAAYHAERLVSILKEPATRHGRWLFPQLSNLTFPVDSEDEESEDAVYSGLLQLAKARAQQETTSSINTVTMHGDCQYSQGSDVLELLKFHIPNLHFKFESQFIGFI